MGSGTTNEDSRLIYIILFVCAIIILTFIVFKLYNKVNELYEKMEGIINQKKIDDKLKNLQELPKLTNIPDLENQQTQIENETENENEIELPVLEELKEELIFPPDPGPSKLPTVDE